jgi:hypothetical protein
LASSTPSGSGTLVAKAASKRAKRFDDSSMVPPPPKA